MIEDFNLDKEVTYELIYDKKAFRVIKERFSSANCEDAGDFLREDRIAISIPGVSYRDFFIHSLDEGYYGVSFGFQMLLQNGKNKDFCNLVEDWLAKNEKRG